MERSDSGVLVGAVVVLLVGACAGGVYLFMRQPPPQELAVSGFDVSHVDAPPPPPEPSYEPPPAQASSPRPMLGSLQAVSVGGVPTGAAPEQSATAATGDVAEFAARRKREQEFLQRHGSQMRQYMGRMGEITGRYYKSHPVVRDVDKAFAAMPRYMAVKARYGHDPFAFAREATALPEVRAEISKRMKDPAVWKAAIGMMLDTMKQPPPAAIYNEAKRFLTQDPSMVDYMPKAGLEITQNVPAMIKGIPPGADLAPLQRVAQDVAPPGMAPPAGSSAGRR